MGAAWHEGGPQRARGTGTRLRAPPPIRYASAIVAASPPSAPRPPQRPAAGGARPGRLARAVLLAVSALLAAAVAEVALRLARPQFTLLGATFYAPDPELGFGLAAGHDGELVGVGEFRTRVRVDHRGLRVPAPGEATAAAAAGAPRVLGVGDSFLFGWGVEAEETFLALASRRAGAEPLDAGVPNYSVCQSTALATRLLPELAPRVVVVALFAGNDELDEATPVGSYRVERGRLRAAGDPPRTGLRRAARALADRSHLLRALRSSAALEGIGKSLGARAPARERLLRHALLTYAEPAPPEVAAAGPKITRCLRELAAAAGERGASVLPVLVPADLGVVPGALAATAAELGQPGVRYRPEAPRERLAAAVNAAGLPLVDLHASLGTAVGRGEAVYYPNDRHFTPAGHAAAAGQLAPALAAALGGAPPEAP